MENLLQPDPDINLVYTINEPAAAGAYEALQAAGATDEVTHRLGRRWLPRCRERRVGDHRRHVDAVPARHGGARRRGDRRLRHERRAARDHRGTGLLDTGVELITDEPRRGRRVPGHRPGASTTAGADGPPDDGRGPPSATTQARWARRIRRRSAVAGHGDPGARVADAAADRRPAAPLPTVAEGRADRAAAAAPRSTPKYRRSGPPSCWPWWSRCSPSSSDRFLHAGQPVADAPADRPSSARWPSARRSSSSPQASTCRSARSWSFARS